MLCAAAQEILGFLVKERLDWLHVVAHSALPFADDEHDYVARVFGPWLGVEEVRHFPA